MAFALPAPTVAQTSPGYFRHAAAGPEHVVFTAEGDLWRVGLGGGAAVRLTTHMGLESRAAISPDGKTVAFSATIDGVTEVHAMPLAGGATKRLTYEGDNALVVGWTPAGEVLYTSANHSGLPTRRLLKVGMNGTAPQALPVAKANDGAIDGDGRLFFTRNGLRSDNARRYRGGSMAQIWALAGQTEAVAITHAAQGNNSQVMVWGGQLYFVSDRSGARNLWRMERDGSKPVQLTRLSAADFDLRQTQLHSGKIAYTVGADLHVFDIASGQAKRLNVSLTSDFEQRREHWVTTPMRNMTHVNLAPNGERVAITARGRVLVAGTGDLRRVEINTPISSRSRVATFSADSGRVFVFNDESGEQELQSHHANGSGAVNRALTVGGDSIRWGMLPSPDGKWMLHHDHANRLHLTNLSAPSTELIDAAPDLHASLAWAPDSSAFTFSKSLNNRQSNRVLHLVRLADKKRFALTTDRYAARNSVFSPDGKWLLFLSDRHLAPSVGHPWGSRNMGVSFDKRDRIYALALQAGTRWPYLPRDELGTAEAVSVSQPNASSPAASSPTMLAKTRWPAIAFEGVAERLFEVPAALVPPANIRQLDTDGKRLYFLETDAPFGPRGLLKSVAFDSSGAPADTHSADLTEFQISANGRKLMTVKRADSPTANPEIAIMDTGPKPPASPAELAKTLVRVADWSVKIQPAQEWEQIFGDAWRMHRSHFYDPAMHGQDWAAIRLKYQPLVARLTDRQELADLQAQMIGEINALHSQVAPGDVRLGTENVVTGALGGDWEGVSGGLRLLKIYQTEPELPGERGPLALPGMDVRVGDVVTAVNHQAVASNSDLGERLRGQAGKQVLLTLLRGAQRLERVVVPTTVSRERSLRTTDWELSRRKLVDDASNQTMGYLRLRAMGSADLVSFARDFYPLVHRDGLIIDVRGNSGGSIDSIIIEKLMRRAWMFWQARAGGGYWNMHNAFRGHIVVLLDEDTYSDGETFSEGMRRLGLATLIGKRSSGAGVWLSDRNRQSDGGMARAAETGQYAPDGTWLIEGTGVSPDIEVDNLPRATFNGEDAQLQAAIGHLKRQIASKPLTEAKQPPIRKM